ncbi:MAG TPA: hypothetical protein IAD09_07675 [Candidatus Caccoplasma merdavium]|nr:hypothetical protein [Candidatus Caccoplasma merdavium]
MEGGKIIDVYRGDLWECQLLESILLDAGIDCFPRNNAHTPYGPITSKEAAVIVMTKQEYETRADALLQKHGYIK